ncbi:MAG: helix-turn-helix domain-containing protein [Caldisphaera sp.]
MWRARKKNNKIQLSFKYRIYPTREVEEKLLKIMQVEVKVYNALLDAVNNARKEGKKITPKDTQAVDRKPLLYIPFSEGVYSKFSRRSRKSSPRGEDALSVRAG